MSFPFHYFFENIDLRWRLSTQLITLWTCVKKDNIGLAQIFENSIIENKNPNHRLLYSIYYNKTHYTMYFVLIPLNLCKCFKIHNVHMRYRKNIKTSLIFWRHEKETDVVKYVVRVNWFEWWPLRDLLTAAIYHPSELGWVTSPHCLLACQRVVDYLLYYFITCLLFSLCT